MRGGAIGDFMLSLPLLHALRAHSPQAHIEILGYPRIAGLAVSDASAHSVRRVDGAEFAPIFAKGGQASEEVKHYLAGFDMVVCVWSDADGVLRENLRGAGVRRLVHVNTFPPRGQVLHVADHMASQFEAQGIACAARTCRLDLGHEARASAHEWIAGNGLDGEGIRVRAVHPGSGSPKKTWSSERFAEAIATMLQPPDTAVILAIGPADEEADEAILSVIRHPRLRPARNLPLPQLAALVQRCELFLGNDSGVTHIAAAVGAPTLALFGPTDPRIWAPRGKHVTIIQPAAGIGPITAISTSQARAHLAPQK